MNGFERGRVVLIRHISRSDGSVGSAIPARVVRDDRSTLVLYIAAGTPFKNNWAKSAGDRVDSVRSLIPSAERRHSDQIWRSPTLRFYLSDVWYSIWLHFDTDFNLNYWYGNLEVPHVRTELGIDTRDLVLDVVVTPDGKWRWKDEEEFQARLEQGLDSESLQKKVRAAGEMFIKRYEQHQWPFDDGWERWRPPADWGIPALPDGWDVDLGTHGLLSSRMR